MRFSLRCASTCLSVLAMVAYLVAVPGEFRVFGALLLLASGNFLSALIHEMGHALIALARRWRVVVIVVRPIGWQIHNNNLAWIPRDFDKGRAGWVLSVPTSRHVDTRHNWSLIVAGGPVASGLFAMLAVGGGLFMGSELPAAIGYGPMIIGLALQSLHSCVFSLLPKMRSGGPTDGEQLRSLWRAGGDYKKNRPLLWLISMVKSQVRLREVPDWLWTYAHEMPSQTEDVQAFLERLEIGRALDEAEVDIASTRYLIDQFKANYAADAWLAACEAYFAAVWEGRSNLSEATIPIERPAERELWPLSLAADAAISASEDRYDKAEVLLDEMDEAIKSLQPFRDPTFVDIRSRVERLIAVRKLARISGLSPIYAPSQGGVCVDLNGVHDPMLGR